MIKIEQIDNIINIAKLLRKEKMQYDKARDKWNNQYDLFHKALSIEKVSHKLHCACVNWWIADYEEQRYWEKIRINSWNEVLVNFEKPY